MTFDEWLLLAKSKESFERSLCLDEIPQDVSHEQIVPVLLALLEDEDELVRTCAAEELAIYSEHREELIKDALKKMLEKESSVLAQSYAIISFCELADENDLSFIIHFFQNAGEAYLKINVATGLFLVAQKILIKHFDNAIWNTDNDYPLHRHLRSSSINLIKYAFESIYLSKLHVINTLEEVISQSGEEIGIHATASNALEQIINLDSGLREKK
ncbi:hypothetical protein BegalDRAFT_0403 [Beggiatoa alba B18LD]|uniref:HEAT repeat domain-containing protein n=1 Tax=Beggiatoa alba B18LD TaxID=395493 RepID=I3CCI0_9GAMM|nr:HEAT repeat domain-containing protein [Beggiatoa alba]EIJ41323.1 hypothetical protein BegalDRAFT_0403 [Beggiatoa alba B18LD]